MGAYTMHMYTRGYIVHKKGKHFLTFPTIIPTFDESKENIIRFTDKSKYIISDQKAFNTIFGITLMNSFKTKGNSVRFIWRCYNDSFQIGVSVYFDGKQKDIFFKPNISTYELVSLKIRKYDTHFSCFMSHNGEEHLIMLDYPKRVDRNFISLLILPYFGGNETAPKDVEYDLYNNTYQIGTFKKDNNMILNF